MAQSGIVNLVPILCWTRCWECEECNELHAAVQVVQYVLMLLTIRRFNAKVNAWKMGDRMDRVIALLFALSFLLYSFANLLRIVSWLKE